MRVIRALASALVALVLLPCGPASAQQMQSYTVRDGDTCGSIARRVYGNSRRYDLIHQHNPELGPMPHDLAPGTVLSLPDVRTRSGAEATVTAARRQVRGQPPQAPDWDAVRVGQELDRGWRVSTGERSSADLTFQTSAVAHVREQTLVIVYGGGAQRVRREGARAVVREGSVLSRISALSGGEQLEVETPSALATLSTGEASVDVDGEGTTRVAVHQGDAAAVSRPNGSGRVRVRAGMGTRVARGRPPTPPRPLPPAPTWSADAPRTFLSLGGHGGTLRGAWGAVENAHRYRVEVARREDGRDVLAAIEVGADVTELELHRFPPGTYFVRVATIDEERFEGRPAQPVEIAILDAQIVPPGGAPAPTRAPDPFGLEALDSGLAELDFETVPEALPRAPRFSSLSVPDGVDCGETTLREAGRREITCRRGDEVLGALSIEVTDVAVRALGPDGSEASASRSGAAPVVVSVEGLEDVSGLTLRGLDGATAELTDRSGGELRARVTASETGSAAFAVVSDDALALEVGTFTLPVTETVAVEIPEEAPPPFPAAQESFGLAAFPSAVGLVDERRRGSGAHLAATLVSAEEGEAEVRTRLSAGVRLALLEDRLRVDVAAPLDLTGSAAPPPGGRPSQRGSRDLYAAVGSLLFDEDAFGLAAEAGVWLPTAGDQGLDRVRLRLAVDGSMRVLGDQLILRTRQAALLDLSDDGSRLWASAYGADWRAVGPLVLGVELGLVLGDEEGFRAAGTAGLAVALDFESVVVALSGRAGFGDHALVGLGAATLAVRGQYDL